MMCPAWSLPALLLLPAQMLFAQSEFSYSDPLQQNDRMSRWQPVLTVSANARDGFDERMRQYLKTVESLRLLAGARNSGELQYAWREGQSRQLDGEWAIRVFDYASRDLGTSARWAAAYHLVKPDAPGDVKRSTRTSDGSWTEPQRMRAIRGGNFMAGRLGRYVGLSDEQFELAAGMVQVKQDVGYIIDRYARGECAIRECYDSVLRDHRLGHDDPDGRFYTGLGRTHEDYSRREAGAVLMHSIARSATSRFASRPGNTESVASKKASTGSLRGRPDRSFRPEGDVGGGGRRHRYLEVMDDQPGMTFCNDRDGCD